MKRRVVLHLISSLEGGGAERQLAMLAKEQARRGWTVHIGLRRGGPFLDDLRDSPVAVHWLGDRWRLDLVRVARMARLIARVRPSVVQTWLPHMDITGGAIAAAYRIPWVLSERNIGDSYADARISEHVRTRLAASAAAIVCNSATGRAYWQAIYPRSRVVHISNALDRAGIAAASPAYQTPKPLVLFVGRLTHQKAPEVVIDAISRLEEGARCLLIGEGSMGAALRSEIAARNLEHRVSISGFRRDWWTLAKVASVLVSPSRFEGHPNVVLEAIAARCPVIVSDIPVHREFLDDSMARFVPVNDSRALAHGIQEALSNPVLALERADRATAAIEALSVDRVADAYERVYVDICA